MWTEEHRRIYRREGNGYPSDLRDVEWARLEPTDPAGPTRRSIAQDRDAGGDERDSLSAAHRLPLRYLPRDRFPPRSTVYNIFRKFQGDGVWEAIWAELHMALRGPGGQPVGGGSRQPVAQSAEKGAVKTSRWGYDAGKKVKGRKIHARVDSEGLPIVHLAAIQAATAPVSSSTRYAAASRGSN
jgi:putative transposase